MKRSHNALGQFLLEVPASRFCSSKIPLDRVIGGRPLFDTMAEIAHLSTEEIDRSGLSKVLTDPRSNAGPKTQDAIESAIRIKLAKAPEAADYLIGQMSNLIQIVKTWDWRLGHPTLLVPSHLSRVSKMEGQIRRLQTELARRPRRLPKPEILVLPPLKVQEDAFTTLRQIGISPKDITRLKEATRPVDYETYLAGKISGPKTPGMLDTLHRALLNLTPRTG